MEKSNFNPIGNKPLAPTIYDENITPLESMNKLTYKINQLIGDDTNVKEVVDKLLDVYSSHMKLQGGYCEELRCIAFENPISCDLIKPESPIYTPVKNVEVGVSNVKGDVFFYQWQYKNKKGLFVDLEAQGSNSAKCYVPVTFYNSGDTLEFRCKLQNDKYSYYTDAIVIEYTIPTGTIIQSKNGIVNTYEQNQLTFNTEAPTESTNIGWMWSIDNNSWNEYGSRDDSIKTYYYIDKGTKNNGVSVGESDKIYWKYQFKVNDKEYFSNTLITNVTKVDFDCGSATVNGAFSDNWQEDTSMVQCYSYRSIDSVRKYLSDIVLSLNKTLNSDIITSVQWLYKKYAFKWTEEPNLPTLLLTNATNINSDNTITIKDSTDYISTTRWAFRLQVIVGNVAYYSDVCYCYFNFTECEITTIPTSSQVLNSKWEISITPTGLLTDDLLQQNMLYVSTESATSGYKTIAKGTQFTVIPTNNTEGNITIDSTKTPIEVKVGVGTKKTVHLQSKVVLSDYVKYYGYASLSIKS